VSTDLETRLRRYGDTLEHAIAARTVEAIPSSANDAFIEHAAAETAEPGQHPGWRRAGRVRLIRRLVLVTLCSGILVVAVLLAIRSSGSTPSVTSRPSGGGHFTDPILGLSASIPNGWHPAQQPLVGSLDPQELLSVGTIPLPANTAGPACDAQLPKTELDHLQPTTSMSWSSKTTSWKPQLAQRPSTRPGIPPAHPTSPQRRTRRSAVRDRHGAIPTSDSKTSSSKTTDASSASTWPPGTPSPPSGANSSGNSSTRCTSHPTPPDPRTSVELSKPSSPPPYPTTSRRSSSPDPSSADRSYLAPPPTPSA